MAEMPGARFIQVNHLHPDNSLHLNEFKVHRFDDIPASAKEEAVADIALVRDNILAHLRSNQEVPPSAPKLIGDRKEWRLIAELPCPTLITLARVGTSGNDAAERRQNAGHPA